ncbi:MAG: response regulator [Candidatus Micrarchaeota archaeon]
MILEPKTPWKGAGRDGAPFPAQKPAGPDRIRKSATILVVDDDRDFTETAGMFLEIKGYSSRTANNGLEGLETYKAGGIDLVVSDMHMPHMNGLEMLIAIKRLEPSAKVIVCSGGADEDEKARLMQAGALAVLKKPVEPDILMRTIESNL